MSVSAGRWFALAVLAVCAPAHADWQMNLSPGATAMTRQVWDLHTAMLVICALTAGGVVAVMAWSIVRHRKSRGARPADFHESIGIEIAWTVLPFLVLAAIAIPAASTLVTLYDTDNADVTIQVTGHQWLWEYRYPEAGVHFYSRLADSSRAAELGIDGAAPDQLAHYLRDVDKPLVVPVHAKIKLEITSADVIHSWWVPALGGKKDAIPGRVNKKWFRADTVGTYRGQCAELCGRGHAFMPIVVKVVSKADYLAWLQQQGGQGPAAADLPDAPADFDALARRDTLNREQAMTLGKHVYKTLCAACHQRDGAGLDAAGYPALTGSDVATGPIAEHIRQVIYGKNAMPAFGGQLSNAEIAAVVTYERNALGNSVGDQATTADVEGQR
ncbi:cytochrome c oxidase subunit II [uncultured Salinisphaera sp.]|uniref:cytochrome c oxidase subunit II n=1 Tax=uncultured Salinisphaera sp. TaxID=359372 RepID=UPI0032B237F4|tara:strand:+ start:788 stop:1945 length:1158 start_codon:yes stop_codon:yes gene_type:complete